MTISPTSYLRRPPTILAPRQVLAFNGILYSIDICDLTFERLKTSLYELTFSKNNQRPSYPAIFSDVWTIINNATIFTKIVTRHFGIDRSDISFENLDEVKHLRDSNQHIDERIEILLEKELPIYGSLSWYAQEEPNSNIGTICTIHPGTFTHRKSIQATSVNPFGQNNSQINDIEFETITRPTKTAIEMKKVKLNKVMSELATIINDLEDRLNEQLSGREPLDRHESDLIFKMDVRRI